MFLSAYLFKHLRLKLQMFFQSIVVFLTSLVLYAMSDAAVSLKISFPLWWLFLPFVVFNLLFSKGGNFLLREGSFLATVVFYPAAEELMFRGLILWHLGLNIVGCVLSALIFSMLHLLNFAFKIERFSFSLVLLRFLAGLLLAISVVKSAGNIFPALFYHSLINLSAWIAVKTHIK